MGLLKHFRSRSNLKKSGDGHQFNEKNNVYYPGVPQVPSQYAVPSGRDFTARLPEKVITRILEMICPHSMDKSYEPCEDADIPDEACPLCDLRDLTHCAQTRRGWYRAATQLLYTSIRIDAVHYCALEEILTEKR